MNKLKLFSEQEEIFKERTGKEFTFFYNKYYPKLVFFTGRMVQSAKMDPSKAEDISTDSFLTAFDKIEKYDKEKAQFSTWLFTIAKHITLQEIKNHQKTLSMDVHVDDEGTTMKDFLREEDSNLPEQDLIKNKADIMMREIYNLKEPYRTVIEMREIKKMSYKDISDTLERNLSTIKSQIRNGRAILISETKKEYSKLEELQEF